MGVARGEMVSEVQEERLQLFAHLAVDRGRPPGGLTVDESGEPAARR